MEDSNLEPGFPRPVLPQAPGLPRPPGNVGPMPDHPHPENGDRSWKIVMSSSPIVNRLGQREA